MNLGMKFLGLLCMIPLFCTVQEVEATDHNSNPVVKVAFLPEMFGFYGMEENGSYSGYNHDYLMNVVQFTGWEIEYVEIAEGGISQSLMKAYEMLEAGELDLVGNFTLNEAYLDSYEVCSNNYGLGRYNMYSARNKYLITEDNYFMQENLNVALVSAYEELNEKFFFTMEWGGYGITTTYVDTQAEAIALLLDESVDIMINIDTSENTKYLDYLTTIDRVPFYFISTLGNTELIAELDQAIEDILIAEPAIHSRLLEKHFGVKYDGDLLLTTDEYGILEDLGSINIGLLKNLPPYQYENEAGELLGITVDVMEEIFKMMEIDFNIVSVDSVAELQVGIADGSLDMIATLPYEIGMAQSLNVTFSRPYLSSGVFWLRSLNETSDPQVFYHFVSNNIPYYKTEDLTMTMNVAEVLERLTTDNDVSIFCDPYVAQYYIDFLKIDHIQIQTVSNVLSELSFGLGKHLNSTFLGTLNRAILHLDESVIDEIICKHTTVEYEYSLKDFFRDYGLQLVLVMTFFFGATLIYIVNNAMKFKDLSQRDGMTKLYNSGYFHQFAGEQIPNLSYGALILIDIDLFKAVNDYHGHQMGDEIIRCVAANVKKFCEPYGTVTRLGGDEFAVLISVEADKEALEENCKKLLEAMANNHTGLPVTLSIGGYIFDQGSDYKTVYKKADEVLYAVKERGRNGYAIYSEEESEKFRGLSSYCLNYPIFQEKASEILSITDQDKHHVLISMKINGLEEMSKERGELVTKDFMEVIGKRLKRQIKATDLLGSRGDDVFLLMLQFNGNKSALENRVESLQSAIEKDVALQDKVLATKTTIAVALHPEDGKSYEDLLKKMG